VQWQQWSEAVRAVAAAITRNYCSKLLRLIISLVMHYNQVHAAAAMWHQLQLLMLTACTLQQWLYTAHALAR
jgi:hypothetical protein